MLNKQNERREWAGEGGVMVLNFHISREGGCRCEPKGNQNLVVGVIISSVIL